MGVIRLQKSDCYEPMIVIMTSCEGISVTGSFLTYETIDFYHRLDLTFSLLMPGRVGTVR
jgi:hypothetical protein